MVKLIDKYQKHLGRVFLVEFFALLNGQQRGTTTTAIAETFKTNVIARFREVCEKDLRLSDPEDPRVKKYAYLRIRQETGHLALGIRANEPWTKRDGDVGVSARLLNEAGEHTRTELTRANEKAQRSVAPWEDVGELELELELDVPDDNTLPEFLRGV